MEAISDSPVPTNNATLRKLLGLVDIFRRSIYKFAEIVSPLYGVLRKGQTFKWTSEEDNAFRTISRLLIKAYSV